MSIGLPVYNGDRYLRPAIDSLLGQSFADFELIISDNASTDLTEMICRDYEKRDGRILYFRHSKNMGAAANFNFVFQQAKGKYFKWAAHDDVCLPNYLRCCVETLDSDQRIVLCHTGIVFIDEEGKFLREYYQETGRFASVDLAKRFREAISLDHWCVTIFGVHRLEILRRTPLIADYVHSDRNLLAEISLYGPIAHVPELLFLSRDHANRSIRVLDIRERVTWFNPERKRPMSFIYHRVLAASLRSLFRVPMKLSDRIRATWQIVLWARSNARTLGGDLLHGVRAAQSKVLGA